MTWTQEKESRLLELLKYEAGLPSMREFMATHSPRLPPPRHLDPIINAFERTRRERVLTTIEMPPRHAKTTTCIHGLGWRIHVDPGARNAYCSYAQDLSFNKSRKVRQLARQSGAKFETENMAHWETIYGGGLAATGVEGPLTGKGIDGIAIVDDPIKNRSDAESKLIRDKVWDWFTDVVWSRLEEEASVFVVMTRWHKDDLAGRLLKGFEDPETGTIVQFERIKLSALAGVGDPLGREPGEALWPSRFPRNKLLQARSIGGPYSFASLYQQEPQVKGDAIFTAEPARFVRAKWELDGHRILIACDPAATAKTSADHTAILVMAAKGYGENMNVWVLDHFRKQCSIPDTVRVLRRMQREYWGVAVGVESVGAFKAIPDLLREEDPYLRVLEITPLGDKFTRAQPVASAWNEGRVHVPTDVPWANTLIHEANEFTGVSDPEDDQIDALAHGFNTLFGAKAARKRGHQRSMHLPFG